LLVKIVDIAVEDLNEEFNRHSSVHASICNTQRPLETFQDSFPISVELKI
jgi:hypothetical protein